MKSTKLTVRQAKLAVITAAFDLDRNFNGVRWYGEDDTDRLRWKALREAVDALDAIAPLGKRTAISKCKKPSKATLKAYPIGKRVVITGGNLYTLGKITGYGEEGEPWVRTNNGDEWSALDVSLRDVTAEDLAYHE